MGYLGRTVNVEIDVDDILEALDEVDIVKMADSIGPSSTAKTAVIHAINDIRAGRLADAQTALEREFLPKWKDRADCEAAYATAMGRAA